LPRRRVRRRADDRQLDDVRVREVEGHEPLGEATRVASDDPGDQTQRAFRCRPIAPSPVSADSSSRTVVAMACPTGPRCPGGPSAGRRGSRGRRSCRRSTGRVDEPREDRVGQPGGDEPALVERGPVQRESPSARKA
jgi:hypothetical protein